MAIWEFRVRPGSQPQFQKIYGADGQWAQLFRRSEGYVRTELLQDPRDPERYITLDFWGSQEAYECFKDAHAAEYEAIDKFCQDLTISEVEIGKFVLTAAHA